MRITGREMRLSVPLPVTILRAMKNSVFKQPEFYGFQQK